MTGMHANDMSSTTSLTPATPAFTLQALPARSLRAAAAPAPAPLAPAPAPLASDAVLPAATIALTAEEVAKHTTLDDCWCACLCDALGHRACRATISPSPAPSSSPSINLVRYIYKNAVYDVTAYMADDLHPGEIGMRTAAATCSGRHSHPCVARPAAFASHQLGYVRSTAKLACSPVIPPFNPAVQPATRSLLNTAARMPQR